MKQFGTIENVASASPEQLTEVPDIGTVSAECIRSFFADTSNQEMLKRLQDEGVNTARIEQAGESERFAGMTFVITGTLPNLDRKQAAEMIEQNGGKVSGSVSKKTTCLLAGENAGSKLAKAKELGIRIIDEEELLEMIRTQQAQAPFTQ